MKIEQISFYAVPFDSSYKNVFSVINNDGTFTKQGYKTQLKSYFDTHYLKNTRTQLKAYNVRRNELFTSFNVNIENIDFLDVNYAIIETSDKTTFWFINSIEQLNEMAGDEGQYSNCKIVLENDVWSNYQDCIYEENREQLVETTHIQQFVNRDGTIDVDSLMDVYPNQNVNLDYSEDYTYGDMYNLILWANIKTTSSCNWVDSETEFTRNDSYWNDNRTGYIYTSETYQNFFIPIRVVDPRKSTKEHIVYMGQNDIVLVGNNDYLHRFVNGQFPQNRIYQGEDIISVRYTFHVPSEVELWYSEIDDLFEVNIRLKRGTVAMSVRNNAEQPVIGNCFAFRGERNTYEYNSNELFTINSSDREYRGERTSDEFNHDEDFNVGRFYDLTPLLHRYPYDCVKIKMGAQFPIDIVDKKFNESFTMHVSPSCDGARFTIDSNFSFLKSTIIPKIVETSTSLPVTASQVDVYMRNNGQRISTSINQQRELLDLNADRNIATTKADTATGIMGFIGGALSAIGSAVSFNFGDAAESFGKATSSLGSVIPTAVRSAYTAKEIDLQKEYLYKNNRALITDLSNQKDITVTPQSGENDIVFQDGIIPYRMKIDINRITHNNYLALVKANLFGFDVNKYMKISEFPMRNFVYLKTADCVLTSRINTVIKNKLESILNNGVRCWRIKEFDKVINMDYNCSNYFNTEAIK